MTTYEVLMVMLTMLTIIVPLIGIIVKLLLIIIDKSEKNNYLTPGQSMS